MVLFFNLRQLPSQTLRKQLIFSFQVGDMVRVYHLSTRDGILKRLLFEGICIYKKNRNFNSSFTVRSSLLGIGIDQLFCTFGSNIFHIECLSKNSIKSKFSKLYFLKKKTYVYD